MRVIAPYNKREKRSQIALERFAPEAEWIDTSASIYAYGEAVAERWTAEDDLVVIEADKEITAEVLPSFADCTSYWCSYSYFVFPKIIEREVNIGLGCARYSAKLQKLISPKDFLCEDPSFIFGAVCELCKGKGCWKFLDARIADAVRGHGIDVHCHGRINHYHDYPSILTEDSSVVTEAQILRAKAFCADPAVAKLARELSGPSWEG